MPAKLIIQEPVPPPIQANALLELIRLQHLDLPLLKLKHGVILFVQMPQILHYRLRRQH